MRRSAGFLFRFFVFAAALFALWSFSGFADAYARAVIVAANPFMWLLTGFSVSATVPTAAGLDVVIRSGTFEVVMPFQPREIFSGVVPFLALVGASARLTIGQRLRALIIGLAVLFVFHMGLMMIGPYMTGLPQGHLPPIWIHRVNTIIDIFYGFYGLVGFAALPFLLWFWLAYRPLPAA